MNEIKTKYFQTCDFCHKEVETNKNGLLQIWLPGNFVGMNGLKVRRCVEGCICNDCAERLYHKIKGFLDVKVIEYGGTAIQWKEDVIDG